MAERFVKAIRFRDVKPGDTVVGDDEERYTIVEIKQMFREDTSEKLQRLELFAGTEGGESRGLIAGLDVPIRLIYRPLPEGKTENDVISAIHRQVGMVALLSGLDRDRYRDTPIPSGMLTELRETIEAWELSRPFEPLE